MKLNFAISLVFTVHADVIIKKRNTHCMTACTDTAPGFGGTVANKSLLSWYLRLILTLHMIHLHCQILITQNPGKLSEIKR